MHIYYKHRLINLEDYGDKGCFKNTISLYPKEINKDEEYPPKSRILNFDNNEMAENAYSKIIAAMDTNKDLVFIP
jgi:hypothetical protein